MAYLLVPVTFVLQVGAALTNRVGALVIVMALDAVSVGVPIA